MSPAHPTPQKRWSKVARLAVACRQDSQACDRRFAAIGGEVTRGHLATPTNSPSGCGPIVLPMSYTVSRGEKLGEAFKGFAREMGTRLVGNWTKEGFDTAADVSTSLLARRIEELHQRNRSGKRLTQQEQHFLTALTDIKSEMERELGEAWEGYPHLKGR